MIVILSSKKKFLLKERIKVWRNLTKIRDNNLNKEINVIDLKTHKCGSKRLADNKSCGKAFQD